MEIEHDLAGQRFVAHLNEGKAVLAYQPLDEGVLDLCSVYVPPAARGRQVADRLVVAAIAHADAEGYRIIPTCSYVAAWFRAHPEEGHRLLSPA